MSDSHADSMIVSPEDGDNFQSPSPKEIPVAPPTRSQRVGPMPVSGTTTTNNVNDDDDACFIDDGHIHVCVRIRDVPTLPVSTPKGGATPGAPRKSTVQKEANKICVSTIDNVVVMHDPKSLEDSSALARDTNNVVQLLTDRANAKSAAGGAARSKSATARTRSAQRRSTFTRGLTSTASASYYECDQCITSMDESSALRMPLIRSSDFLQPPAYGAQEDVYRATARHAVKAAVEGINSCVFAYGQTGSGKTYTLFGDTQNVRTDPGVVPRTLDDLFERLQALKVAHSSNPEMDYSFNVGFSFFEIYQNDVFCLLSRQGPLHVQFSRDAQGKKETMVIHDLQQQTITSAEKAYPLIELGLRRRQTGETGMNARSSRSHAIFQIRVAQFSTNRETRETVELHSTINLVDLAGSERQKTAKTEGKNREEGIQINQSLATLARVINDIASGAKFINYRDSLLTMVLKDNLGGNSKTFMIATVSPVAFSFQESCSTLTYAKAVRKIRNRPTVNRTFQTRANLVEQNARLKAENDKLKDQMEEWMKRMQQQQEQQSFIGGDSGALERTPNLLDGISPIRGGGLQAIDDLGGFLRGVNGAAPLLGGHDGVVRTEALVAATSAGLTTPLLVASHRRYTSVAGIGMACVEGGVARVASLVRERMSFPLKLSASASDADPATVAEAAAMDGRTTTGSLLPPSVSVSPEIASLTTHDVDGDCLDKARSTTATLSATPARPPMELGSIELERVCQRSCEQHFWVRYVAPASGTRELEAVLTVQLNGKDLGATRRELAHGDVICAYIDDPNTTQEQHLLTYHYVDLNCLSRTSASTNRATLGQLAISVELPEDVENLTLENIQQLQRDNAKLLDMVRQQAQAVDYHVQKEASRARMESVTRLSSAVGSRSDSPNPLGQTDTSAMRADAEEEALLRRAREASESGARLDSAMRENAELHKRAARRNATLDALAERLAALEAGDGDSDGDDDASSSSSSSGAESAGDDSYEAEARRVTVSASPSMARQASPTGKAVAHAAMDTSSQLPLSMSRVSSPSASSDDENEDADADAAAHTNSSTPLPPALRAADAEAARSNIKIFYENADGTRERYNAAVIQREQQDKIAQLQAIIDDLRMQLALLESRLRVAKDDTLEEELARQAVEAERDALARQLQDLQSENAELARDNNALEIICHENEDALRQATEMNEEEIERRLAIMAAKNKALHELARLWKRRTMKHIAMGYGGGDADGVTVPESQRARPEAIPWDELRFGATAGIAKQRLGASVDDSSTHDAAADGGEDKVAKAVDEFEQATALDALIALEAALKDFETENRRLLDEVRRYEAMLQDLKDLIARLRNERDALEKEAANASMNEEESRRLKGLLDAKMAQLHDAEANLEDTQNKLSAAVEQSEATKQRARKNNELLLAEQKRTIESLEDRVDLLQTNLNGKEEELRNLLRYMEENELAGADGAVQDYQLRGRIEDLIADAMKNYDAPTGYSAFPADFEFTEEMIALIRVCLRILLDRLKVELYVLNRQNLHKLGLIMPTVQLRPEAQFHSFMHELRGVVVEIGGRAQRIGGRWSVSEADVLAELVDHRRRRASGALYGLLVWYDHWDMSPKLEHVCYMELIRNADRVLQIARQVRQLDVLNTNATSTLMMPIPGKNGCSDAVALGEDSKKSDQTTIQQSCEAINKVNASLRRSNLAKFCNSPSKNAVPVDDDYELNSNYDLSSDAAAAESSAPTSKKLFRRTATALVMSQTTLPFSRTATATAADSGYGDVSPSRRMSLTAARRLSDCPMPLGRWASATSHLDPTRTSTATVGATPQQPAPQDRSPPQKLASRRASGVGVAPTAFGRVASTAAMPVSEADIAYVASSEVVFADSINKYNYARRASLQAGPGDVACEALERKPTSQALPFSRNASAMASAPAKPKRTSSGYGRSATAVVMPASSNKASKIKPGREAAGRPSSPGIPRGSSSSGAAGRHSGDAKPRNSKKLLRSQTAIPSTLGRASSGGTTTHTPTSTRPKRTSAGEAHKTTLTPSDRPRRVGQRAGTGAGAGGVAAPRVAGASLFGRTKSTVSGPAAKSGGAAKTLPASGAKLMRSHTTATGLSSAAAAAEKAPRRSGTEPAGKTKARPSATLAVTEVVVGDPLTVSTALSARSVSTTGPLMSPKPRTPCGSTFDTHTFTEPQTTAPVVVADPAEAPAAAAAAVNVTSVEGRTSAGGPTPSFYNPNVLSALRERSTSESNQATRLGKSQEAGHAPVSSSGGHGKAKKTKRTGAAHKIASHGKRK